MVTIENHSVSNGSSIRTREEVAKEAFKDIDPLTRFLYTPHTLTALFAGICALAYFSNAFNSRESSDLGSSSPSKTGLLAVILVFLGYSVCQGPETKMIRPHPAFWRLVHGVVVVYLLAIVWLLFQDVQGARRSLKHLYPELGVELGERSYGADCRLFTPEQPNKVANLWATLFDEFVIAHTLGWVAEALVLRHFGMLLTVSVGFELMELTFQHWLPNFNECWWDSWILDVAICNNIGIVVGMALVAHFKGKTYHWSGVSSQKSVVAKVTRGLGQFLPYSFDSIEWEWMSGPTRLVQCLIPCAMNLQFKVVAFFLKYILWIPPTNPLNTIRLIIWFLMCLPATLEYYEYINNPSTVIKIGYFAWLTMFVTVVEILICIKFGRGMFTAPWPPRVLWFWGAMSAGFAAFLCTWYLVSFLKKRRKSHAE